MEDYFTGTPLKIGQTNQLLIDDTIVEDRWRLTRVMHHPDKYPHNPILACDKPWESDTVQGAQVIWDEEYGKYRMWYLCFCMSNYYYGSGPLEYVAYAESDDGFHWVKPLRNLCPFGSYPETNIVYYGTHDQGTYYGAREPSILTTRLQIACMTQVFKDRSDPDPARRYKMISIEGRPRPDLGEIHACVNLICSPDGIHWKLTGSSALFDYPSDCLNHLVYDSTKGRWLLYCRTPIYHSGRPHGRRNIRRRVAAMTSKDLVHWTYPRIVCYPDEYDPPDYDHVLVFPQGNLFLMLYGAMQGDSTAGWDIRLASSQDGFRWERYHPRETFLGPGQAGAWDAGGILPTCPPVRRGERLLLYYSGFLRGQEEQGDFSASIGLATLRLDRFIEQRAGDTPGYLLTREFILDGKMLRINAEENKRTSVNPRLRVEILRHPPMGEHWLFKQAYEGFSLEECDPLAIDHTDAVVTWKGRHDLSSLAGKPVYLRFELQHTGLFSFRISNE